MLQAMKKVHKTPTRRRREMGNCFRYTIYVSSLYIHVSLQPEAMIN
jgi:hypothetical protein